MMRLSAFSLVALLCAGCGTDSSDEINYVQVATFNTGLARGYVDHAALRFDEQLSALSGLEDLDVLCLQEVWDPSDRAAIIEGLSEKYPHSHFSETTNATLFPDAEAQPAACTTAEAEPLAECARPVCEGEADIASCVLAACGDLFDALSPECQACAASNIGLGDVDEILAVCLMEGVVGYSYDGQNGLLLLSTAPIETPGYQQFDSFLTSRGVLLGTTHGMDVACTHLTSRLADPVYSGSYESYAAENAAQIDSLLSVVEGLSEATAKVVTGDFNTGPMLDGLSAELPDNFAKFAEGGWGNPNTESAEPLCTWCEANLITGGSANEAIDHVFVKGGAADQPRRLLGGEIVVTNESGEEIMTSYSDHFGLSVRVALP